MSDSSLPKITIITPSYNQGEFLEDTIRSVLDQNYPKLEYFVIDGGSTDNSVEIIKRYAEHFDWWVSEKDRGQSHAINKGLERATGEVVTWLNSDDFFYPGALDVIAQAAQAHPDAGLFIGNGTIADRQGRRVRRYSKTLAFDYDVLLRGANYILQPSTFLRKRVFDEQGPIDEKITYGMDLELWLRVGNKYPVVTIDEELAAFRWYDEVKSVSGGFKEWVSMYEITRRYCKDPITPGLVLEFFKKLQDQKVQAAAGFTSLSEVSQKTYWTLYQELQSMFGTNDCIPRRNRGIAFKPRRKQDISVSDTAAAQFAEKAPASASSTGQLVVDVVLPAGHSWFVREGYVKALEKIGSLGRVLYVPSWKKDEASSAELFEHLGETRADVIFLMDTMWHAQQVHATEAWRRRWAECPARKVMFSFECMSNPWLRQNSRWWSDTLGAVERAAACVDGVVFAHEIDESLFRQFGLPALWQPFAVDENILPTLTDFSARKPRAFFKGKADAFYNDDQCYQARRRLIKFLRQHSPGTDVIDKYSYADGGVLERNQQFLREMGEYQAVVGLPSLSPTMVVRPFEALLSGCVFFQNRVQGERSKQLFRDGEHLFLYDADQPEQLAAKIQEVLANPEMGRQIAENGRREVLARHTIQHRVAEVLPWVKENVTRRVSAASSAAPTPSATSAPRSNMEVLAPARRTRGSKILIDGITFEFQNNRPAGISRVWTSLLKELSRSPLARDIILLDRGHTAPRIPGIETRPTRRYDLHHFESDSIYLQQICDREKAGLFISTYYTYPENTPSMIMLHDMIPESTGQDLSHPEWRAKAKAIEKAFGYFCVSQSTRNDFQKLCPEFTNRKMFLTPNAVGSEFLSMPTAGVTAFRLRHEIEKPYFLLVGNRTAYKNAHLFFRAFSSWQARDDFEIVCVGGADKLENCFGPFVRGVRHHVLRLNNEELAAAYTGAVAVVYPSRYEGFGLPVLEAHKCGCPVITCRNSSLPEVAGEAALFVGESDVAGLRDALSEVQKPETRERLIALGSENIRRFSWESTARIVADAIQEVRTEAASLELRSSDPLDTVDRLIAALETEGHSGRVITNLQVMANVYRGRARYQRESASASERKVVTALATIPERISRAIPALEECDSLLSYVFGLVAENQREFPKAVSLYTTALKSVTDEYGACYRMRLGLRLANLAARNERSSLAKSIIEHVVIPSQRAAGETVRFGSEARELLGDLREQLIHDRSLLVESRTGAAPTKTPRSAAPLVSAIVSTCNSEKFLRGCLEDLERQTIADRLEIVVVDSGSTQDERGIVEEFQAKYSNIVYLRTEERETLGAAWNRGIKAAQGKYLTNANTDDRHRRDALEILAHTLDENPEVVLAYGDCHVTRTENETFETAEPVQKYQWLDFNATDLLQKGCFVGPQPMWRRRVHEEHGYFNADYIAACDYEFWLRLAQNKKFLHVKEFLGLYLESPTSMEHDNREDLCRETAEAQQRYADAILKPGSSVKRPAQDCKAIALGSEALSTPRAKTSATVPAVVGIGGLDQARALLAGKKYQDAWESTTAALKVRPFHPQAYLLLAQIALSVGDGVTARRVAQRAHDLAPQWKPSKQFLKKSFTGNTQPDWLVVPESKGDRLTVCVIARNEEQFLAQCLQSVRGIAKQIVVVDTGSTDRTMEIAKQHGAEVHSFPWCDDFSAARNVALEHAAGDWVLSLDADEELPSDTQATLREHLGDATAMAFRLPLVDHGKEAEGRSFVPRLFRNAPGLFWNGRVHEQVFGSVEVLRKQWKLENKLGEATILHHGYSMDAAQRTTKSERNRRLLKLALTEQPNDTNLLMNLGLELTRSGQLDEGIDQYRQAVGALANQPAEEVTPEFLETLLTQLCTHLMAKKHFEEVVGLLHSSLAQSRPLSASLHFALGLSHMEQKQFDHAAKEFRQCLARRNQPALTPINTDILTSAPNYCLATCLAETGPAVEALKILQQIVTENAVDSAAWILGGSLALQHPDFIEFACDWAGEAIKYLPENPELVAKRAEALLLSGKPDEALPLWLQTQKSGDERNVAAVILCEILTGKTPQSPPKEKESFVSQEFLKWYRRILNWGQKAMLLRLNESVSILQASLPGAATALEAALTEAAGVRT